MSTLDIHATLSTVPSSAFKGPELLVITRGASAELLFSFFKYSYLIDSKDPFKYIDQITFLFEQDDEITYFEMFDEKGAFNEGFGYDESRMCFSLLLSPLNTSAFKLASHHNPMKFEVAIKANTEIVTIQKSDSIIIEPQRSIIVVDSLYNKANLAKGFK